MRHTATNANVTLDVNKLILLTIQLTEWSMIDSHADGCVTVGDIDVLGLCYFIESS